MFVKLLLNMSIYYYKLDELFNLFIKKEFMGPNS